MSAGDEYRKALEEAKQNELKIQERKRLLEAKADTDKLSHWFNQIAKELPGTLQKRTTAVRQGEKVPGLDWEYSGYDNYKGTDYRRTEGFMEFKRVCETLDVCCEYGVWRGENPNIDTSESLVTLDVSVIPELKYGEKRENRPSWVD